MDIPATARRIDAVFEVQKSRAFYSDVTVPLLGCDRQA
jgi:hypothetical protein